MHASILFASFATAALVALVNAHGALYQIEVAGQTFTAPLVSAVSSNSGPISVPSSNGSITDVTSDDMFCNSGGATPATTASIDLSKGNNISFYWNSGYSAGTNWIHNTGPMILYMAKCTGDCSSQTALNTEFMNIEQQGFDGSTWSQAALDTGAPATFTIPSDIASGNYILRHEIMNLASVDENHPSCSWFTITGGSNSYSSAQTVTFPGGYSASDPGLSAAGSAIYSVKTNAEYTFPGPAPVIASDGSSSLDHPLLLPLGLLPLLPLPLPHLPQLVEFSLPLPPSLLPIPPAHPQRQRLSLKLPAHRQKLPLPLRAQLQPQWM
ncbi:hypothetical protein BT96DRAFT_633362 [Gymnopus androsaceus JB14]|uniref:lytic cellulose monooxygenase (C4-dehydrogenating) n=1 Tax=Gymnopus androsaceus JB14 TaxID=1447944 RepID=A0A6A4GH85_9AGAR|nr:hypothetical protein BT96DRAFT_633362 [Gymnopus androsaceus JB14]